MSITAAQQQRRRLLVDSLQTVFQQEAEMHQEILDPTIVRQETVDQLAWLVFVKGYSIEFTALGRLTHHDDTGLSHSGAPYIGTHWHGWAWDGWVLNSNKPGDYADATTHFFRQFLVDLDAAPHRYQIGLAGEADIASDICAAGCTCFEDDGGSHVHGGCKP